MTVCTLLQSSFSQWSFDLILENYIEFWFQLELKIQISLTVIDQVPCSDSHYRIKINYESEQEKNLNKM